LPPSLATLAGRQALELSPGHFESDIGRLLGVINNTLASAATTRADREAEERARREAEHPARREAEERGRAEAEERARAGRGAGGRGRGGLVGRVRSGLVARRRRELVGRRRSRLVARQTNAPGASSSGALRYGPSVISLSSDTVGDGLLRL